ncbi:MAG TPA: TIGR03943 family protein [Cyanobacteria bacterium UBA8803]|nr:TIGR03943 family protein [Cyanobacteria bacterium UBA9273]HBL59153.1 TIGR03943 family protein [Cyanobacteria bacterium UBA8803]
MTSSENLGRYRRQRPSLWQLWLAMLDIWALAAWGVLLITYWLNGKLSLLIHPNYFLLVMSTGIVLLILAALKGFQLISQLRSRSSGPITLVPMGQHMSWFPPGWSSGLLIITAILGLLIEPKVFTSQTAIQRGVTESLAITRSQPQSFRSASKPEERSLIEWIRTLNVYPEPDAYKGQKVNVQGFIVYPPNLPSQYLLITRFVITCCAADAYPVSLPVKLKGNRNAYKPDTWIEVQGQMITETLNNKRQLTIEANSIKEIPEPANPYNY